MTATIQTPLEIKEINGALIHNPNRRPRGRPPKSPHPLGEPPKHFNKAAQIVWAELQVNAPASVLTKADRHQVELLCELFAKFRDGNMSAQVINGVQKALCNCGLTPVDRQRLAPVEAKNETPFSEFTQ